jgi:hypothetical protein
MVGQIVGRRLICAAERRRSMHRLSTPHGRFVSPYQAEPLRACRVGFGLALIYQTGGPVLASG